MKQIILILAIMVSSVVKAQEVVFVKFKWQADKVVYATEKIYVMEKRYEADETIYFVRYKWEIN